MDSEAGTRSADASRGRGLGGLRGPASGKRPRPGLPSAGWRGVGFSWGPSRLILGIRAGGASFMPYLNASWVVFLRLPVFNAEITYFITCVLVVKNLALVGMITSELHFLRFLFFVKWEQYFQ